MKKVILLLSVLVCTLFSYEKEFEINRETIGVVRALPVYKYPRWISKIELKNGKSAYFVSPKSMFGFYYNPSKWKEFEAKDKDSFSKVFVTDYVSTKPIDATKAFFVYGSNKISPAGDDLVAFVNKKDAEEFMKSTNGKRVLTFDQVTNGLISLLNM